MESGCTVYNPPRREDGYSDKTSAARIAPGVFGRRRAGILVAVVRPMSKLLRGVVAGVAAKKMGCGCFGTLIAFALIYWLLGSFDIFQ